MSAPSPLTSNSYTTAATIYGGNVDINTRSCCSELNNNNENNYKIAIFVALCVVNLNMSLFSWQVARVVRSIRLQTETVHGLLKNCSVKEGDLETLEAAGDSCGNDPGPSRDNISTSRAWRTGWNHIARFCSWMIGPAAAMLVCMGVTQVDGSSIALTHETNVTLPMYAATEQRNYREASRD